MIEGDLLSTQEVASRLAISDRTVQRMIQRGEFPNAFRAGSRAWRIPETDLEAYVENQKRERRTATSNIES